MKRVRSGATTVVRSVRGLPHDHRADYDPDVLASLPLAGSESTREHQNTSVR